MEKAFLTKLPSGPYLRGYGEAISPRGDMPKNRVHSNQGRTMSAVMLILSDSFADSGVPPAGSLVRARPCIGGLP
jgi:hypothetical protein